MQAWYRRHFRCNLDDIPQQKPPFLFSSEAVCKQSCGDLTPPRSYQYLFDIISCMKLTLEVEGSLLGFMQP